jgi:hypothetical protein
VRAHDDQTSLLLHGGGQHPVHGVAGDDAKTDVQPGGQPAQDFLDVLPESFRQRASGRVNLRLEHLDLAGREVAWRSK